MKRFLEKIDYRHTDILFLIVGGLAIYLFSESFALQYLINPNYSISPIWLSSTAFVLMIVGFISYVILEKRINLLSYDRVLLIILFVLALVGSVVIFVQPEDINIGIKVQLGEDIGKIVDVYTYIDIKSKLVFFYGWITNIIACVFAVFIIPHRLKSLTIATISAYIYCILVIISFIISFFNEGNSYVELFKRLFFIEKDLSNIEQFGIRGIFPHRNVFATIIEFVIGLSLVSYGIYRKKRYLIIALIYYFLLFFTICKTSIAVVSFVMLIYSVWLSILKIKEGNKKGKILLTIICSVVGVAILAISILLILNPQILEKGIGTNTFTYRTYIWQNTLTILEPNWWLIGRGYGTFNLMLHNANLVSHFDDVPLTHSWIFSSLGKLGILGTTFVICVIGFIIYYIIKEYKGHKYLIIGILSLFLILFFRGFLEDHHPLWFIILCGLLVIKEIDRKSLSLNR